MTYGGALRGLIAFAADHTPKTWMPADLGVLRSVREIFVSALQRMRAEAALRESEEFHRIILSDISDAVFITDDAGVFGYVCPSVSNVLGYTADELRSLGRIQNLLGEGLFDRAELEREGEVRNIECAAQTKDGLRRDLLITVKRVALSGGGLLYTVRDITDRKRAEQALRESEKRYRTTLDSMTDAIHVTDRDGRIILMNQAFRKWCGELGLPDNLIGRLVSDAFPFLPGSVSAEFEQVLRTGEPVFTQERTQVLGREYVTDTRKIPVKDGDEVTSVVTVVHDITDRVRAEEELRKREEHERLLIQQMPILMDAFDENGLIVAWNGECERVTGYSAEEMIGNPNAIALLYPDAAYRERLIADWKNSDTARQVWETDLTCRDGSVRTICWFNFSKTSPIPGWDSWAVGVDVTEQKRAEEALRESEARHRALVAAVPDLMLRFKADGTVTDLKTPRSDRYCYGLTDRVIGHRCADIFPEAVANALTGHAADTAGEGAMHEFEFDLEVDGVLRNCEARVVSIGPDDFFALLRDVTDRRRMESEIVRISAREHERIGQDLHDGLGQQLTGIAFMAKVLARKLADGGLPEAGEAEHIARLVNDAITQTRHLARGLHSVGLEEDGLMLVLQELAASVTRLYDIEARYVCPTPVLISDGTTAAHLYRIAQEAVTNAVRHAGPTTIRIELQRSGATATLAVIDDGCGIPGSVDPGVGMGLNIMRYRARMMGGAFSVKRLPEGGTCVSCTFQI